MITSNINSLISAIIKNKKIPKYINMEIFNKLVSEDYSEAYEKFNNGFKIHRGIQFEESMMVKSPIDRMSKNTSNVYTRLFSEILPSWKNYPKRNHSFICTSSYAKAWHYANTYYVFPKNGTKLGICSSQDIWTSFNINNSDNTSDDVSLNTLNDFNNELIYLIYKTLGVSPDTIKHIFAYNDINDIIKVFTRFELYVKDFFIKNPDDNLLEITDSYNPEMYNIIYGIKTGKSIIDILDKRFNPTFNNLYTSNIKDYNIKSPTLANDLGVEIWFDNDALFVIASALDSAIDERELK